MNKVFVYGTLKRGYPNYSDHMTGIEFFGEYRTTERYPLVIGGPWNSPNLLDEPGNGYQVKGEIFLADDETLAFLDTLESTHLPTGYRRVERLVERLDSSTPDVAWVYVRDRQNVENISEELSDNYPLENSYVHRSKRLEN